MKRAVQPSHTLWLSLVVVFGVVTGDQLNECLTNMTNKDYSLEVSNYFLYCKSENSDVMERVKKTHDSRLCDNNKKDKIRILNFKEIVPENPKDTSCKINRLRHKKKMVASCLWQSERDSIIRPFIETFSGRTVGEIMNVDKKFDKSKYGHLSLDYECEKEDSVSRVDMCETKSQVFHGRENVSLSFNEETFRKMANISACYCSFKNFNTSSKISAQAYDVRLNWNNKLSMTSSVELFRSRIYWWQSGVLSDRLTQMTLSGLSLESLPHNVWININGRNMNITCDSKPLEEEEKVPTFPKAYSGSSSLNFGTVHIVIIIIGVVFLIILVACLVKFLKPRFSGAAKSGVYAVEDPESSVNFLPSHYDHGEEPSSPDSVLLYSAAKEKPDYPKPKRKRKDAEHEEAEEEEAEEEEEEEEMQTLENGIDEVDNMNNNLLPSNNRISHSAVIHDRPKVTTTSGDDDCNIYNHFKEQPDVVPPNTSENIYDTTGADIYSELKTTKHQISKTENVYDVA